MVAHFTIGNVIDAKIFLLSCREFAYYIIALTSDCDCSIESHEISTKPYILLVGSIEIAFGQAYVVYGIQDIGFAHAVITYEAIDFFRKNKVKLFVVFEISKVDGPEKQSENELSTNLAKVSGNYFSISHLFNVHPI
jgi:hypothetical protein